MRRILIITAAVVAALAIVGGFLLFRGGGEMSALAQLDAAIAPYDGLYAGASYDAATDRLVIDGLMLRNYAVDADAEPLDLIEIGHIEVTGIARRALSDVLRSNQEQDILGQLDASDLSFTEEGQIIRIARLSMSNVTIVPPEGIERSAEGEGEGEGEISRVQMAARAGLSLRAGRIEITGFASPDEGMTGMRFDSLVLMDVSEGTIGSLTAGGLALWDQGQVGTVGDTINLAAEAIMLADMNAQTPLRRLARGDGVSFDRQSDIPTYLSFQAEGVVIEEEEGDPLVISSFRIQNDEYVGAMATDTLFSVDGLRVPLRSGFIDQTQTQALRDLGYDELVFGLLYRSEFDPASGAFELADLSVGIEDMGEFTMRLSISDIPFTEGMTDQTTDALLADGFVTSVLERARMGAGALSFRNQGLIERLIQQGAARTELSTEDYMAEVMAELQARRLEAASAPLATQSFDALINFLEDPRVISVTVAPDAPVPFSQMVVAMQINPILLVEMLNLQVRVGE